MTALLRAAIFLMLAGDVLCLTIESSFEGASVRVVEVNEAAQRVRFMPGGDPRRGWPCWWQFRVTGLQAGKPLVLELQGSDLPMPQANGVPSTKPLPGVWAKPDRASFSTDGKTWHHTEPGRAEQDVMTYTIQTDSPTLYVAWGPPYTPSQATAFVREAAEKAKAGGVDAEMLELCKSREGRSVPMLRLQQGERAATGRFGIWIQARQHAWESGASWVCQGVAEWLLGGEPEAVWLREHAEIFIVPIMDVDNTATGNGGKEALPQDHNRDWQEKPNWNEVAAAQVRIRQLAAEKRMDLFLDLHNPAAGDRKAFFYALPAEIVQEPMLTLRNRFIAEASTLIREAMPMLDQPKYDGPKYHPLWRQMSGTWVSMNANPHTVALCLETPWNIPESTVQGYKAVGAQLAKGVRKYLGTVPQRP